MMMMMVMMIMIFTTRKWVIIPIEVGDGLFDRGLMNDSSLMEVTIFIHGIVYKSGLIGHWHATHPVVSIDCCYLVA